MDSKKTPHTHKQGPREFYKRPGALLATVTVLILGLIIGYVSLLPKGERIIRDGYQVVYMVSGQAYFGKLKNTSGDYLVLSTPYTAQDVQSEPSTSDNDQAVPQGQTTLLKVSQQQYGPEEAMSLKSDQVLFWQNLRDDSKVSEAIKSAK